MKLNQHNPILNYSYRGRSRSAVAAMALLAATCAVGFPGAPRAMAQYTPAPQNAPADQNAPLPAPGAAPAPATDDSSSQWPISFYTPQGQVTVYQPQVTKFDGDTLNGRSAVSILPPGATDPTFGAIWMQSRVATDRAARTVRILDVKITRTAFPDSKPVDQQTLSDALSAALPQQSMTLSLDQLLADVQILQQERAGVKEIANTPPKIIFQTHPSVLVQYDGQPRFDSLPNTNIQRAENTPFFVGFDPASSTYFLKGGGHWFDSGSAMGPFRLSQTPPQAMVQASIDSGYVDPQTPLTDDQARNVQIITATEPTELIWTDGGDQMTSIAGTSLLYVSNTDSDVFVDIKSQKTYVLISGRWFAAPNQNGPWTYVAADQLPDDFKQIPPTSDKGDVLASVAGTQQAKDAVADAFVPQTAAIDRTNFDQPQVNYDGDPQFAPVADGSACSYAVNSPNSICRVNQQYYLCSNGVWYIANSPRGQWAICTSVPSVIYTIPPSCPVYPCRYVYVYSATPQVVYCGYLPGYVGCYPHGGVVVYGTGYHYKPWIGRAYYPRPYTYGFSVRYDAYSGYWGFHVGFDNGDASGWFGERSGTIARHGGWFGHGGYRPVENHRDYSAIHHYSVPEQRGEVRRDDLDLYRRRKDVRPEYMAHPQAHDSHDSHDSHDPRGNHEPVVAHEPPRQPQYQPQHQPQHQPLRDDVYTDNQGHVYRHDDKDGWQQQDHGKWIPAPSPRDDHHDQPSNHDQPGNHNQPSNHDQPGNHDQPKRPETPGHQDTPEAHNPAPQHDNQPRDNPPHDNTPHNNTPHDQPPHVNAPHDQAPNDQAPHDQAPHDNTPRDNTPHDNPPHDNTPHDQPPHVNAPHEQAPRDNAPRDNTPHDQSPRGNSPQGNAPKHNDQPAPAPPQQTHSDQHDQNQHNQNEPDQDRQARDQGKNRQQNYPHDPKPSSPPPHEDAPHDNAPHGNSPHESQPHDNPPHDNPPHDNPPPKAPAPSPKPSGTHEGLNGPKK